MSRSYVESNQFFEATSSEPHGVAVGIGIPFLSGGDVRSAVVTTPGIAAPTTIVVLSASVTITIPLIPLSPPPWIRDGWSDIGVDAFDSNVSFEWFDEVEVDSAPNNSKSRLATTRVEFVHHFMDRAWSSFVAEMLVASTGGEGDSGVTKLVATSSPSIPQP